MTKESRLYLSVPSLMATILVFLTLSLLSPVLAGNGKGQAGSGKSTANPGVDLTFGNNSEVDKLISDRSSDAYSDGVGGVYALINESNCPDTPACGDLVFDPDADFGRRDIKKGLEPRSLILILDAPQGGGSGLGIFEEGVFVNVDGLGSVTETLPAEAVIHFSAGSLFLTVLVSETGGGCWSVDSAPGNVASHRISKTPGVWEEQGSYLFPFGITVCLQP